MTYQNQAPPGPSDSYVDRDEYEGPYPRPFDVWIEDEGWCSACLVDVLPIVRFGSSSRCVGLCRPCLSRLIEAWATPPSSEEVK